MRIDNYNTSNSEKVESLISKSKNFKNIYPFNEGVAWALNKNSSCKKNKYSLIDEYGDTLFETQYIPGALSSYNDMLIVKDKNKYGCIDKSGNVVIPFIYSYIYPFIGEITTVVKDNLGGCIDKSGNVVIPLKYSNFYFDPVNMVGTFNWRKKIEHNPYQTHVALPGIVDIEGNELLFSVRVSKRLVDVFKTNPNLKIKPKQVKSVKDIKPGSDEFYVIYGHVGSGLRLFQVSESLEYIGYGVFGSEDDLFDCLNGNVMVAIESPENPNLIFKNGVAVIYKYKHVENSNGKRISKCKYSFINASGVQVIDYIYDGIYPLLEVMHCCKFDYIKRGMSIVKLNNLYGLINIDGEELIPCEYDQISLIGENIAQVKDIHGELSIIKF